MTIEYDEYGYQLNMVYDKNYKMYYTKIDLCGKKYKTNNNNCIILKDLKCNLYLGFSKRSDTMEDIHEKINKEISILNEKIENNKLTIEYEKLNEK